MQPVIPRVGEGYDPGFSAYTSMLVVDGYYNNPIVNMFCTLLSTTMFGNLVMGKMSLSTMWIFVHG